MFSRTQHLGLLAIIVLLSACASTSTIPDYQQSVKGGYTLSAEEEYVIRESDKLTDEIKQKGLLLGDKRTQAFVDQVMSRLVEHYDDTVVNSISVHILRSADINAFATGNRHIYIHSGIFSIIESEDQFAALLAHELAHILERHNLKSLIKRKNTVASAKIANFFTLGLATLPALSALSNYSKDQESEADTIAVELMYKAGYDARQILSLFENLEKVSGRQKQAKGFWASHPTSQERIEALNLQVDAAEVLASTKPMKNISNSVEDYSALRTQRVKANIKMRLRTRQFHLAIDDLDTLASLNVILPEGQVAFLRAEALLGLSLFPKDAAKEKAQIEFGDITQWKQFEPELLQKTESYRKQASELFEASLEQNPQLHKAMLKLGEIADVNGQAKQAVSWYERYKRAVNNDRDKRYADRLIERSQKTLINTE